MLSKEVQLLEEKLNQALDSEQQVDILNELAVALSHHDPVQSREIGEKALQLAESIKYQLGIVNSYIQLAEVTYHYGDYNNSLRCALKALPLARSTGLEAQESRALTLIGNTHHIAGDFHSAQQCYLDALRIIEKSGDKTGLSSIMTNIGIIYGESGNHVEAVHHLQRGIDLAREAGMDGVSIAQRINNLAVCYSRMEQHEKAIEHSQVALELFEKHNNQAGVILSHDVIASSYLATHNYDQARAGYEKALSVANLVHSEFLVAYIHRQIAALLKEEGRYQEAISLFESSVHTLEEQGDKPDLIEAHQKLSEAYKAAGYFEKALAHHEIAHLIHKEVFNQQSDLRLKMLQTVYEVEKARLEKEVYRLKSEALEQQITIRERDERQRIALAVERERQQALQNLFTGAYHDLMTPITVIQTSAYLLGRIKNDENKVAEKRSAIQQSAEQLTVKLQNMMLMAKLDAPGNEMLTLQDCLSSRVVERALAFLNPSSETTKRIEIQCPDQPIGFSGDEEFLGQALGRMIDNALRFSDSDSPVVVSIIHNGDNLVIKVCDQGQGIEAEKLTRVFERFYRGDDHRPAGISSGLGLSIARAIIEKHGGGLEVESIPGKGTTFRALIPLHQLVKIESAS